VENATSVVELVVPPLVDWNVRGDDVLGLRAGRGRHQGGQAENRGVDPGVCRVKSHYV
jgi:hypothetical protein